MRDQRDGSIAGVLGAAVTLDTCYRQVASPELGPLGMVAFRQLPGRPCMLEPVTR